MWRGVIHRCAETGDSGRGWVEWSIFPLVLSRNIHYHCWPLPRVHRLTTTQCSNTLPKSLQQNPWWNPRNVGRAFAAGRREKAVLLVIKWWIGCRWPAGGCSPECSVLSKALSGSDIQEISEHLRRPYQEPLQLTPRSATACAINHFLLIP